MLTDMLDKVTMTLSKKWLAIGAVHTTAHNKPPSARRRYKRKTLWKPVRSNQIHVKSEESGLTTKAQGLLLPFE